MKSQNLTCLYSYYVNQICRRGISKSFIEKMTEPKGENNGLFLTFLRFLCRVRLSMLPLPCRRGFEEWEELGVEGGVASGESGSFFSLWEKICRT